MEEKIKKLRIELQKLLIKRSKGLKGFSNNEIFLMAIDGYCLDKNMKWRKERRELTIEEYLLEKLSNN